MAKFFGNSDRYLIRNDLKYISWVFVFVFLVLASVWLVFKYAEPGVALVAALVGILIIVKVAQPLIGYFKSKSGKFYRGWSGERDIKNELRQLPDGYSVFQDLMIGEQKG